MNFPFFLFVSQQYILPMNTSFFSWHCTVVFMSLFYMLNALAHYKKHLFHNIFSSSFLFHFTFRFIVFFFRFFFLVENVGTTISICCVVELFFSFIFASSLRNMMHFKKSFFFLYLFLNCISFFLRSKTSLTENKVWHNANKDVCPFNTFLKEKSVSFTFLLVLFQCTFRIQTQERNKKKEKKCCQRELKIWYCVVL